MKIVTVLGARPQFIKAASVLEAFKEQSMTEVSINTGQHYDFNMSDIFFRELSLPKAKYNLGVGSGSHGRQTGAMLSGVEDLLLKEEPDAVVVYGDTNSTVAGALAGAKLQIAVIHIEAGLRSFNRAMPEEINRVVTDHVSSILFCPSELSKGYLAREGIVEGVHVVGDVMYDIFKKWRPRFDAENERGDYCLLTMHRAENSIPDVLRIRLDQLAKVEAQILYPIHPRTRRVIESSNISLPANVEAIEPLGWLELMKLANNAQFIITDSGGLQKEAMWLGKHCITIRNETEWMETVEQGVNRLVGLDDEIPIPDSNSGDFTNPYGEGNASSRVAKILIDTLEGNRT